MDSTLALGAFRIARGAGGEGVDVNGSLVERESSSASSQCIKQCINHHPEPRSGLCPELLADFRIPKPPGCSQGRRGQFSVQSDNRFSGRGGGGGASPGRAGELGCQAQQVLKKIVRLASVFPSPPFRSSDFAGLRRPRLYGFHTGTRSLSNRKGRGRRSGGRELEPRRAGEGRCLELNS